MQKNFIFKRALQTLDVSGQNVKDEAHVPSLSSINQIFSLDHGWTATLSAQRKRVMIATGDVIPARSVNSQVTNFNDFKWPYLKIASFLKKADITFINLESPLLNNCPVTMEGMVFCGNQRNIDGLIFAGVDIANLANNHAGNYGTEGAVATRELLNGNGIKTTGINGPEVVEINGLKIAFLGYNDVTKNQPGISNVDEEKIKSEIFHAKSVADLVVVAMHWGIEYQALPDQRQKGLAHFVIDAGADLIIGNHPHWIQPVEIYKGKLITYAHGNFIFDQEWSLSTKQGVVGKYTFYDNKLVDLEFFPILIENYGQPKLLEGLEKTSILENMRLQSARLNQ